MKNGQRRMDEVEYEKEVEEEAKKSQQEVGKKDEKGTPTES